MTDADIKKHIEDSKQVLSVLDYGADPTGEKDSTIAIQKALKEAKTIKGTVVVDFPTGTYKLNKAYSETRELHTSNTNSIENPVKHTAILIEEQEDLIINGNNSLFLIHGNCMAIAVTRSKNIKLYNFSWDFKVPTTIEMRVSGIGVQNDLEYTDFYIPECFHYEIAENAKDIIWYSEKNPVNNEYYWTDKNHFDAWTLVAYHPDRNITRRYEPKYSPFAENRLRIKKLGDSAIRIFYKGKRPYIHQKDLIFEFCATPFRETAGSFIWESSNVEVEKVNVHYMHAFGWLTQMSHNVTYRECKFVPRKETNRYTTSYADLIHVSGLSGHILIEGCTFTHAHDDPINVHGTYTRVKERVDDYTVKLQYIQRQQGGFPQYYKGNEVEFFRRDNLQQPENLQEPFTVTKVIHPGEENNDLKTMIVEFDRALPDEIFQYVDGEPLFVAENITYTPSVTIRNNHFEAIPTRGILCTTRKKVVIENNVFINMTMDAIYISNDAEFWYESGLVMDMSIVGNDFYVPKVGNAPWRNAAIRFEPITMSERTPKEPIHKNILIKDNRFFMEHESVLAAKNVDQITFKNNEIHNYFPEINKSFSKTFLGDGTGKSVERKTFEFENCSNVLLTNNKFGKDYSWSSILKKTD